jgi:hypothetical protein
LYISEKPFTYDEIPSYLFGLKFAWIDQNPDTIMASAKDYNFIKNKALNKFSISKTRYESPLQFDAEMVSDRVLQEPEVRKIYRMFFNSNTFKELSISTGGAEKIILNCIMVNPERIEGGIGNGFGVVGFKCTIICDSPWGWTEEKVVSPKLTEDNPKHNSYHFIINNNSDSVDYIYPSVSFIIPARANCLNGTRTERADYCIACSMKDSCRNSITVPKKAMIINITDDANRPICVSTKMYETKVIMTPSAGTIKDELKNSLIPSSSKGFIRLLPGENVFYAENINKIEFKFKEARVLV